MRLLAGAEKNITIEFIFIASNTIFYGRCCQRNSLQPGTCLLRWFEPARARACGSRGARKIKSMD